MGSLPHSYRPLDSHACIDVGAPAMIVSAGNGLGLIKLCDQGILKFVQVTSRIWYCIHGAETIQIEKFTNEQS